MKKHNTRFISQETIRTACCLISMILQIVLIVHFVGVF